jgi:hypothetical protein
MTSLKIYLFANIFTFGFRRAFSNNRDAKILFVGFCSTSFSLELIALIKSFVLAACRENRITQAFFLFTPIT